MEKNVPVESHNSYPDFDEEIYDWIVEQGCENPVDPKYGTFTDKFMEVHECFGFRSKIRKNYCTKILKVHHYLIDGECEGGKNVLCVTTTAKIDNKRAISLYEHTFRGTHKVGKCPYCTYKK